MTSFISSFSPWVAPTPSPVTTDWLVFTGFGLNIPAGATINSITARFTRAFTNPDTLLAETVRESDVRLHFNGATVGSNKSVNTAWGRTITSSTYTGNQTYWGTALTVANINSSTFGFAIKAQGFGTASPTQVNTTAYVFEAEITVAYTTSSGTVEVITKTANPSTSFTIASPAQVNTNNTLRFGSGSPFRNFKNSSADKTLAGSMEAIISNSSTVLFVGVASGSGSFFDSSWAILDDHALGILFIDGAVYGVIRRPAGTTLVTVGQVTFDQPYSAGFRACGNSAPMEFFGRFGKVATGTNLTIGMDVPLAATVVSGTKSALIQTPKLTRFLIAQNTKEPNVW